MMLSHTGIAVQQDYELIVQVTLPVAERLFQLLENTGADLDQFCERAIQNEIQGGTF